MAAKTWILPSTWPKIATQTSEPSVIQPTVSELGINLWTAIPSSCSLSLRAIGLYPRPYTPCLSTLLVPRECLSIVGSYVRSTLLRMAYPIMDAGRDVMSIWLSFTE